MARNCQTQNPASLRFPIPRDAVLKAEGGTCNDPATCGDRHVLVVEQGRCRLWESYASYQQGGQWYAYSTAAWDLKSHAMKKHLWAVSEVMVPQKQVFDFNQALMDFGAMVCVARNPKCLVCPMSKSCAAFKANGGTA